MIIIIIIFLSDVVNTLLWFVVGIQQIICIRLFSLFDIQQSTNLSVISHAMIRLDYGPKCTLSQINDRIYILLLLHYNHCFSLGYLCSVPPVTFVFFLSNLQTYPSLQYVYLSVQQESYTVLLVTYQTL